MSGTVAPTGPVRAAVQAVLHRCHDALAWVRTWWQDLRDRHTRLLDDDPRYGIALAAGAAAVVQVTITHPGTAKAITVLLQHLLDTSEQHPRSTYTHWRDEAPRTASRPLWGRSEWMDE